MLVAGEPGQSWLSGEIPVKVSCHRKASAQICAGSGAETAAASAGASGFPTKPSVPIPAEEGPFAGDSHVREEVKLPCESLSRANARGIHFAPHVLRLLGR